MGEAFPGNLFVLSEQDGIETVADPDTLADYAERIPVGAVEALMAWMIRRLTRMRALDAFRLYGYFTIAIDGSHICTFDHQPWPGCPHRKRLKGSIRYYADVLDAKLVSPRGLTLSLAGEMRANEGNTAKIDKHMLSA